MFGRNLFVRDDTAVSVVEVLIALAVLIFGIGHLAQLQTTTFRSASDQRIRTVAQMLAVQRAEELRAVPYEALVAELNTAEMQQIPATGSETVNLSYNPQSPKPIEGRWHAILRRSMEIQGAIEVQSIVEWGDPKVSERKAQHVTYVIQ